LLPPISVIKIVYIKITTNDKFKLHKDFKMALRPVKKYKKSPVGALYIWLKHKYYEMEIEV
jgi:hypothetical protein